MILTNFSSILVLKDGRIVEQGTHAELVARGGVFAEMWADQISANDEASAHRKSTVVTGFDIESTPQDAPTLVSEEPAQLGTEEVAQDKLADNDVSAAEEPAAAPVAFPTSDGAEDAPTTTEGASAGAEVGAGASAPVAFPSSDDAAPVTFPSADDAAPLAFPSTDSAAPIAFPGSPETGSVRGSIAERAAGPGVTFHESATPDRVGTPDPDADGKRRRTLSTQGIQRLARRISITTRRQGSTSGIVSGIPSLAGSIIPGLKRQDTARSSTDEGPSKDAAAPKDSPSPSVASEPVVGKPKGSKIKKEKKEKRKSMGPV